MTYSIEYSQNARKQLKKLGREIQGNIVSSLDRIRIRPYSFIQKVVGSNVYRLRVKKYRVILDIYDDKIVILVIKIGHRKNIYKK